MGCCRAQGPNKGFTTHNHVARARTQDAPVRAASPADSSFSTRWWEDRGTSHSAELKGHPAAPPPPLPAVTPPAAAERRAGLSCEGHNDIFLLFGSENMTVRCGVKGKSPREKFPKGQEDWQMGTWSEAGGGPGALLLPRGKCPESRGEGRAAAASPLAREGQHLEPVSAAGTMRQSQPGTAPDSKETSSFLFIS